MSIRKAALFSVKLVLIVGIFAFLFWQAGKYKAFDTLWEQPKRWDFVLGAFCMQFFAVSVTFLRWRLLSRVLGLALSIKEAFRLGFLGLMLNLAPMGIVGGDAIKAYLLAKQNPDLRPQAVASVIVDRIIGLLVMFLCGTVLVCWTGFAFREEIWARTISHIVFVLTGVGFLGVGIVFLPFFAKGHVERLMEKIPYGGRSLAKLTRALLLYRNHKVCLIQSFLLTFLVHIPFGIALYMIARGLFTSTPGLVDHIVLYNVVNLTAMIPLAAGPFELVLDQLYPLFSGPQGPMGIGLGLVVALGHRIISILVAAIGVIFYLSSRQEIREAAQVDTDDSSFS